MSTNGDEQGSKTNMNDLANLFNMNEGQTDVPEDAFSTPEFVNATFLMMDEQYKECLEQCDKALQKYPHMIEFYVFRGRCHLHFLDPLKCLAECNEALTLDPMNVYALTLRAEVNNGLGNHDDAISDCNTALEIEPTHEEAYFWRGAGHFGKGNLDLSLEDFNRVSEESPVQQDILCVAKGEVYLAQGKVEECMEQCAKALAISPTNAKVFMLRSQAYSKKLNFENALQDTISAFTNANDKDLALASALKGEVLLNLGQKFEAKKELLRAQSIDPDLELVKKLLAQLEAEK